MAMPSNVLKRCKAIRLRSKKGEWISPEEFSFLESCWQQWSEEYNALDRPVLEETAPFGSRLAHGEEG